MNILMIEDSESVSEMMGMFFDQQADRQYHFEYDGESGWQYYESHQKAIEMVILDLNLPGKDGISVCRDIRKIDPLVPIIMLTARDSESDQVLGLSIGADDYVTKPFSPITLVARMNALYRRVKTTDRLKSQAEENRSSETSEPTRIQTEHIRISLVTREAFYDEKRMEDLTPKEFDLLTLLAGHPKQVYTREDLLENLWSEPFYGDERTIDAHIKKLRHKMDRFGPQLIQTVWGVGYKFDETEG
ncbi:MAG: response regulator transcription factor [Aerococcus sp.]|nr:response regulator transcription factor [Aerococcus sp.]